MQSQGKNSGGNYFWDKVLLKRVKEYKDRHPRKNVDVDTMVIDLQGVYSEYNRRKRFAFRKQVRRACDFLSQLDRKKRKSSDLEEIEAKHLAKRSKNQRNPDEDEGSESFSDNGDYVEMPDNNAINKQVNSLYNRRKFPVAMPTNSNPGTPNWRTPTGSDAESDEDDFDMGILEMDFSNDSDLPKKTPQKSGGKMKKRLAKDQSTNFPTPGKKKPKTVVEVQKSTVMFSDIGGNDETLQEVCKLLVHLRHPEVYEKLGVTPPRGVLLHGPPGCGKTLLANGIAGELDLPFLKIAATEIVSGISGESEGNIRDIFQQAQSLSPCILFLDEIDAITPKRETAQREMERRIVAQLLSCMDDLNKTDCHVLVIGATNRVDALDPALRRAGRFDREIAMGIPNENARQRILKVLCKNLRVADDFDFSYLASMTPGHVGADLMALCREAALCAVSRVFDMLQKSEIETAAKHEVEDKNEDRGAASYQALSEVIAESTTEVVQPCSYLTVLSWLKEHPPLTEEQLSELCIEMKDFKEALPLVQPSAKREGFATIPDVTWDDVGALGQVREELTMAILAPVRNPEAFESLGLTSPPGILLAGPPGCGKTLLAKAIANESGINFISVKGPELMNMYVGESERAVRQCFQRARNSSPCVIFFDELDALCPRRADSSESGSTARVVNQLLTEMDGLEARKQVFIMGATNRPDIIDPAVLRPGRMDKILYVGIPSPKDRVDILNTITKKGKKPLVADDVNMEVIGKDPRCEGFTGADLASLVREASMSAIQKVIGTRHSMRDAGEADEPHLGAICVNKEDFEKSFRKVKPSVSKKERLMYTRMKIHVLRGQDEEEKEDPPSQMS